MLCQKGAERVFAAQKLNGFIRAARQAKLFRHIGSGRRRRVGSIGQHAVYVFPSCHLQHRFFVGGADQVKVIRIILPGIVRQIVAQECFIAQAFCRFNRDDLLCRSAQEQNLFLFVHKTPTGSFSSTCCKAKRTYFSGTCWELMLLPSA